MGLYEIIFLLVGIAMIVLGIYVKVHNYRMCHYGKKVTAVVAYSEPIDLPIAGETLRGYKNVLHIETGYGTIEKELLEEHPRRQNERIPGYYIEQSDQFMKEADVRLNKGVGPYVLIGFGVLWCGIILLVAGWE